MIDKAEMKNVGIMPRELVGKQTGRHDQRKKQTGQRRGRADPTPPAGADVVGKRFGMMRSDKLKGRRFHTPPRSAPFMRESMISLTACARMLLTMTRNPASMTMSMSML